MIKCETTAKHHRFEIVTTAFSTRFSNVFHPPPFVHNSLSAENYKWQWEYDAVVSLEQPRALVQSFNCNRIDEHKWHCGSEMMLATVTKIIILWLFDASDIAVVVILMEAIVEQQDTSM